MPYIEGDDPVTPPPELEDTDYRNSVRAINKALEIRPDLREKGINEDYANIIHYHKQGRSGIKFWQTEKIRQIFRDRERAHGYPTRRHHTVQFFDLMMFSIPFFTKLQVRDTMQMWDGEILIQRAVSIGMEAFNQVLDFMPEYYNWQWRLVIIADIPDDYGQAITAAIPLGIDDTAIEMFLKKETKRPWTLYEHLTTRGYMSDEFIWANWDKIQREL